MTLKKIQKKFLMIASIAMISSSGVVPFVEDVEAAPGSAHTINGNGSTLPRAPPPKPTFPEQDTSYLGECGVNMTCKDSHLGTCGTTMSCKEESSKEQTGVTLETSQKYRVLKHNLDRNMDNNDNGLNKGDSYVPYFPTPQECGSCKVDSSILLQR